MGNLGSSDAAAGADDAAAQLAQHQFVLDGLDAGGAVEAGQVELVAEQHAALGRAVELAMAAEDALVVVQGEAPHGRRVAHTIL